MAKSKLGQEEKEKKIKVVFAEEPSDDSLRAARRVIAAELLRLANPNRLSG